VTVKDAQYRDDIFMMVVNDHIRMDEFHAGGDAQVGPRRPAGRKFGKSQVDSPEVGHIPTGDETSGAPTEITQYVANVLSG